MHLLSSALIVIAAGTGSPEAAAAQSRSMRVTIAPRSGTPVANDTVTYTGLQEALRNRQFDFAARHGVELKPPITDLLAAVEALADGRRADALTIGGERNVERGLTLTSGGRQRGWPVAAGGDTPTP